MKNKILLSTASLYHFGLERIFSIAKQTGFDGIELCIRDHEETSSSDYWDVLYIKGLCKKYELFIGAVHSPFSNDPKTIQSALELAKQIGASIFVIHTPKVKESKYCTWFGKNISRLQETEHKIKISVENMPKKTRENRHLNNDLKDLANFKFLTLDTCHLASYIPNVESVFSLGLNNIVHMHLSNKTKKNDHLPLTRRGGLDLAGFLLSVRDNGYTGFITLEVMADDLEVGFPEATAKELTESIGFISRNLA